MTNTPRVSVCIPTYNRASYIGAAITSVLDQTFADLEVVVVDNASLDETEAIVRSFTDSRVRYFRNETNLGLSGNCDRCLRKARGEFRILFEDHDLMHPDLIQELVRFMDQHPSVAVVAPGIRQIDQDGRLVRDYVNDLDPVTAGRDFLRRSLRRFDFYFSMTTLIRTERLEGLPVWFDEQHGWYGDIDLVMRLATLGDVGYVSTPLLSMRTRETDHPLHKENWVTYLTVDGIHKANWRLGHPVDDLASRLDRMNYEWSKIFDVLRYRIARTARGDAAWTAEDRRHTRAFLAWPGPLLVELVGAIPSPLTRLWRGFYHWYYKKRSRGLAPTPTQAK